MKFTLIASALFAGTAFAAYNAQKIHFESVPGSAKMLMTRSSLQGVFDCKDNDGCSGLCDKVWTVNEKLGIRKHCTGQGTENYCNESDKKCYCIVQDPAPVCNCAFEGVLLNGKPLPPLDDACHRGPLIGGDNWCIYGCQHDGSQGNGDCNVERDPCKTGY